MLLIGINGFKRSGKGTVANIVSDLLGADDHTVKCVGFADKLKVLGAKTLGFKDLSDQECIGLMDEFKEEGKILHGFEFPLWRDPRAEYVTGRQYLQNLGNEARNVFGDTFWINMVLPDPFVHEGWGVADEALQKRYPNVDCLCITDLRYPNEAARVKALGGVVWEVLRPDTSSDGHASEIPLDRSLVDWQIHNDGDLMDLEGRVEDALEELPC